ncbi:hypothetical protein ACFLQJ_02845 [Calditrichota bacterium]
MLYSLTLSLFFGIGFVNFCRVSICNAQLATPSVKELAAAPDDFSAGLAAAQRWNYYKANLIFHNVANRRFKRSRRAAEKWMKKIEKITSEVVIYKVSQTDTWESIAIKYFYDSSFAARLAAFNQSSIVDHPSDLVEIKIPRLHLEAQHGFLETGDFYSVRLDTLEAGIKHLKNAIEIDPDYPDLKPFIQKAERIYLERLTNLELDSIEKSAELKVARYEFTAAINLLMEAQKIQSDEDRMEYINRLKIRRNKHLPILFEIGNERFRNDDLQGALQSWRKVAEVNPNFRDVSERIEKVEVMLYLLENFDKTPSGNK